MKRLQPVVWSKGTLLTPQHMQTQDRFLESLLGFRLNAQKYRPWGFLDLAINQEALNEGEFTITRAAGLFPRCLAGLPGESLAPRSTSTHRPSRIERYRTWIPDLQSAPVVPASPSSPFDELRMRAHWGTFRHRSPHPELVEG